jgi:uncharacterized protein YigA (DUF484 family)
MRARIAGRFPGWRQVLVSLLVAGLGLFSAEALTQVDRDLRILYTEYTVAATDLAHVLADVMRYRTTIIRALEAPTQRDFERITASLPYQRTAIERTIDRFAEANRKASARPEDLEELQAVRDSLAAYFGAASHTMTLLQDRWRAGRQSKAEQHVTDTAGVKLVQVTLAIDRLLDRVATVGKSLRNEGVGTIRSLSVALLLGSLAIAVLNLFAGVRLSEPHASAAPVEERSGAHPLHVDAPGENRG